MVQLILFAAIVAWFVRQFYGARAARWQRRWIQWYAPMGRLLVSDARAVTLAAATPFRHRRAVRGTDVDAEWRKLTGGTA